MNDEKLGRVLPLLFRQAEVPESAKERLRQQLFGNNALSDDELELVSAAGDLAELQKQNKNQEE